MKAILILASLVVIDAQLSTVSKRFRNKETEFGRPDVVRKSSRGEGRKRQLQAKVGKDPKKEEDGPEDAPEEIITPLSAAGSMSMGDFDFDTSMSMEEMSLTFEEDSLSMVAIEEPAEEVVEEEVVPETLPEPVPEPIGCNGDEYCPIDMKCQCWLFCRFCFFPPCGTCVPN
jgi:hypothetical protein